MSVSELLRRPPIVFQVTVDLDVLVRDDLLRFLKSESETRGATILCKNTLVPLPCYYLVEIFQTPPIYLMASTPSRLT